MTQRLQQYGSQNGALPSAKSRMLVFQLPASGVKRVTQIICGYAQTDPAGGAVFEYGRLIVASGTLNDDQFDPYTDGTPDGLTTVWLDVPISRYGAHEFSFDSRALEGYEDSSFIVLLTVGYGNSDAIGAPTVFRAFLSINGATDYGTPNPFKILV